MAYVAFKVFCFLVLHQNLIVVKLPIAVPRGWRVRVKENMRFWEWKTRICCSMGVSEREDVITLEIRESDFWDKLGESGLFN